MQAGGMPNSRDAGQKCYRKGGMQERRRTGFYRAKVGASNDDREGVHCTSTFDIIPADTI